MKRDMDLIRTLLITLEDDLAPDRRFDPASVGNEDEATVTYHLKLLHDAGLLDAHVHDVTHMGSTGFEFMVNPVSLTWAGHEYLDTIRDEEVWRKSKAAAASAGGFSLKVLASVATAMAVEGAKRAAGLE
jgi:hypothetical protein